MEKPHSYWETVFVLGNRVPIGKPNSYWEIVFILGPLTRTLERQVRYQDVVVGVVHLAAPDGVPDHVQELRDAVLSHVAKVPFSLTHTLHPSPYTLHPTPYFLHPTP